MRRQHLLGELRTKEKELSNTNQDFAREEKARKELGNQVASLEKAITNIGYSEEMQEELRGEKGERY